jgi:hypothetical protein
MDVDPFRVECKEGFLKSFKVYGTKYAPYLSGISLEIEGKEKKLSKRDDPQVVEVVLVDDIHTIRVNSSSCWLLEIKFIGKNTECTTTQLANGSSKEYKIEENEVFLGIYGYFNCCPNHLKGFITFGFILGKPVCAN